MFRELKKNKTFGASTDIYNKMYPPTVDKSVDTEVMHYIRELQTVYNNKFTLEELKGKGGMPVEYKDGAWIVYQKVCYYGGCGFDPITFNDEYEAYKHAYITSLFKDIEVRNHELSGASTKLADINRSCPKYYDCSGMDC